MAIKEMWEYWAVYRLRQDGKPGREWLRRGE